MRTRRRLPWLSPRAIRYGPTTRCRRMRTRRNGSWTTRRSTSGFSPGSSVRACTCLVCWYWKVDRWNPDPWDDVNNTGAFAPGHNYPGEGMLVYPGPDAGLVGAAPSMRLKWLRDGVDDYDYVQLLRRTRPRRLGRTGRQTRRSRLGELDARPRGPRTCPSRTGHGAPRGRCQRLASRGVGLRYVGGLFVAAARGGAPLGYFLLAAILPGGEPVAGLALGHVTELGGPRHSDRPGTTCAWSPRTRRARSCNRPR